MFPSASCTASLEAGMVGVEVASSDHTQLEKFPESIRGNIPANSFNDQGNLCCQ